MMRFIIYRLLGSFLMLMILLLICLWMIRLIPGSYEDLLELDEYNLRYESNLQIEKKPLFYFSVFPVASTIPKNQTIWPEFTWNGLQNEFHQNMVSYFSLQFGKSISDGVSVKDKFLKALPWSLMIQVPAILIILICSVFFAIRSIQYPDSKILKSIDTILIWIHSLPGFWIATLLLLLFANPVVFAWLPSGMQAVSSSNPFILWFTSPQYLILPLISLALPAMAYLVRLVKNGLEEQIQTLYWKRALSSGMSFKQALYKEALPVAVIPLIAWFAGILPALISGSLIIEYIFSIPGIGRLMYLSISTRDWPVVQFLFLMSSIFSILGFLLSDILLRIVDPRIQHNK